MAALPPALEAAAARLIEGVSRKVLAERFARIAEQYRRGGASHPVVESDIDVAAYVFSRLPGTFAAVSAVFDEVAALAPSFQPRTMLDVGAGPGGAGWAAVERWPDIEQLTLLDSNRAFLAVARTLARGGDHAALTLAVQIVGDFTTIDPPRADLVTASFALAEVSEAMAGAVAAKLWRACDGVLALVEPGTPAGFARIAQARAALIGQGAHVLAPCTHAGDCPMRTPGWCHFSRRLPRSRDQLQVKAASLPFEDETFAYLAVGRVPAPGGGGRLLSTPRLSKVEASFRVCAADGLTERRVSRRDREAFARARRLKWGDLDA